MEKEMDTVEFAKACMERTNHPGYRLVISSCIDEINNLREEVENAKDYMVKLSATITELGTENHQLRAEVEELKEARDFHIESLANHVEKARREIERYKKMIETAREALDSILNLHVEGREFMTNSQLYEAVIQDCTKGLNTIRRLEGGE